MFVSYGSADVSCKYWSSNTRLKPSSAVDGSLSLNGGIGVGGSELTRVSNNGAASGSERRVIQNPKGDES